MTTGIIAGVVTPHTPRMAVEAKAPDFLRGVIAGSYALGEALRALEPDLLVLMSAHWVTTFPWYATRHARHTGVCIADEAPDMFDGIAYDRPGDPAFADALIEAIAATGRPAGRNDNPHYHWDYATCVPLQYLDPDETLPVVTLGTCLMADLDECFEIGEIVARTAQASGRRVVFIASCAFAHDILRGPEKWPPEDQMAADRDFIALLTDGRIAEAKAGFPDYAARVKAEMGGRLIATMLGTLDDTGGTAYAGETYGDYGQSSGSGNISLAVRPLS